MELYLRKRHCPGDLVRLSAPITWEECKKTTPYPASDPGLALFNKKNAPSGSPRGFRSEIFDEMLA